MFRSLVDATPWPAKPGSRTALGPFHGCAEARCIAELARPGELLLVVTADTSSALALERELPFFLEESIAILAFPIGKPCPTIVFRRTRILYRSVWKPCTGCPAWRPGS